MCGSRKSTRYLYGDVQESSIRPKRIIPTEYGDNRRREIFLPLLMIGY